MKYKNVDINELNRCTLCGFGTHVKSTFQRHLMKDHGVKLKSLEDGISGPYAGLGRVKDDYQISFEEKSKPKEVFTFSCHKCGKRFRTKRQVVYHKKSCQKLAKAIKKNLPMFTCSQCNQHFLRKKYFTRHKGLCGKQKDTHCILCSFKSMDMHRMLRHFIDRHNLICVPVDEPDFEQALRKAPYTLERAVALEVLPKITDPESLPEDIKLRGVKVGAPIKRRKPTWICDVCSKEFTKERHRNKHKKFFHSESSTENSSQLNASDKIIG